jgi:hypothetical protein
MVMSRHGHGGGGQEQGALWKAMTYVHLLRSPGGLNDQETGDIKKMCKTPTS